MFGTYRTLLALLVVVQHVGGIPVVGAYAVFGFYVLSGYLMTLIMQESYGYSLVGVKKYSLNRFLRIFPMYWIASLISLILIFVLGSNYTKSYHYVIYFPHDFSSVVNNLLLFFPFREEPRLVPPAWALTSSRM